MSRARSAISLGLLLLAASATAAVAHVGGSTRYATITVSRNTVRAVGTREAR